MDPRPCLFAQVEDISLCLILEAPEQCLELIVRGGPCVRLLAQWSQKRFGFSFEFVCGKVIYIFINILASMGCGFLLISLRL